jgi:DNA-binding transcriptional ArsR family regulator
MKDGPNIARIAALLGEPARADTLTALMTDRALTATELAAIAGVTKQTISAHLAKLLDAGLIVVDRQGRHRYFRLADPDVAGLLESLMGVAFRTGAVRLVSSPREPALRKARICYDHLAGELGVMAYEALVLGNVFDVTPDGLQLTARGVGWFSDAGIDTVAAAQSRRSYCRPCMDWSERRQHLAGALGAALLTRIVELGWAKRDKGSRVMRFTPTGERAFLGLLAAGGAHDRLRPSKPPTRVFKTAPNTQRGYR